MIDWSGVVFSGLWITGISLIMAAISFAYSEADRSRMRLNKVLERPLFRRVVGGAIVLFCLGMAGSSMAAWQRGLWVILGCLFIARSWMSPNTLSPKKKDEQLDR